MQKYFKTYGNLVWNNVFTVNTNNISSWESKELSNENVRPFTAPNGNKIIIIIIIIIIIKYCLQMLSMLIIR